MHPYTFRNENQYLLAAQRSSPDPHAYGDATDEDRQYFQLGVDELFTDNPDTAAEARARLTATQPR